MESVKNYLIVLLIIVIAAVLGLYLWQRLALVEQVGKIDALTVTNTDLIAQIAAYKTNIAAAKKTQMEQQKIANDAASLLLEVNKIKETKCMRAEDEKTISAITYFFNSRGLRGKYSNTTFDGQILPSTNETSFSGWSIKQVTENYLILIDYTLKIERTVSCLQSN